MHDYHTLLHRFLHGYYDLVSSYNKAGSHVGKAQSERKSTGKREDTLHRVSALAGIAGTYGETLDRSCCNLSCLANGKVQRVQRRCIF